MKLPERKQIRLQNYDYSSPGAYYVTLCTEKRRKVLSDIIVGQGLAPAETRLSHYGKIAEEQLLLLQKRYDFIKIDKFVIMPDHIHAIVIFKDYAAGASPRPTLFDVMCVYKSLTTRLCKQTGFNEKKLFQSSYFDHVIRNPQDYEETWKYIDENPLRYIMKEQI
ncbi:MAG: transposase [Clostridia bacterium]|nr:hypothetical protein [Oscillospiraceae bacterium]MBQ2829258.1 transposase [Clostridia bacterium]